jgi:type 1 glutamine amidotransferase
MLARFARSLGRWSLVLAAIATAAVSATASAADPEEGFVWLFDGKDLSRWDGNPEFWSVGDGGEIRGRTTADKPTKGNTFIIWRGGPVSDFELRLDFRIDGGNSGIQYRSEELPDQKWVIRGYQADFDDAGGYTGSLYEEKARGMLAKRGAQVKIPAGGKPEVVGKTAEEKEIVDSIKKKDWNQYIVIAKGNHLVHKVNGITTVDLIDEDAEKGKKSGLLALQLHAGPPMVVEFRNIRIKHLAEAKKAEAPKAETKKAARAAVPAGPGKSIVFVAGKPSHGYGAHEHNAGCTLLAMELEKALPHYKTKVVRGGWPTEAGAFDGADAIVMYSDGGGGHMVNQHLDEVDALAKKGVGIVCIHYAVEVPAEPSGKKFLDWIGGYFEANWSVNPHWTANFKNLPDHPITRGVKPFAINDEWYYHMRFRPGMKGVTPILSDLPGPETLKRPDGAHSGNPHVRKSVAAGEIQHVAWASENEGGGRGFGFTGGHDHWNWGVPDFRKVVLNAIVWTAQGEVPPQGVESPNVTIEMLEANTDKPVPDKFDRKAVIKKIADAGGNPEGK